MIEFKVLAIKAETNDIHTIFLLKKNIKNNIIKTILGCSPIVILESLKEWKVAIISVKQRYKSTKSRYDHRIETKITYKDRGTLINIGKSKDNFDKDRKSKCFNCNVYGYMAKDFWKPKKKRNKKIL